MEKEKAERLLAEYWPSKEMIKLFGENNCLHYKDYACEYFDEFYFYLTQRSVEELNDYLKELCEWLYRRKLPNREYYNRQYFIIQIVRDIKGDFK